MFVHEFRYERALPIWEMTNQSKEVELTIGQQLPFEFLLQFLWLVEKNLGAPNALYFLLASLYELDELRYSKQVTGVLATTLRQRRYVWVGQLENQILAALDRLLD